MSDHEPGDSKHEHETPMLHAQEHKGYGEDEGEREEILEDEDVSPEPGLSWVQSSPEAR